MKTANILMLVLWGLILLVAVMGLIYLTLYTEESWYVQVDNTCAREIVLHGGMSCRYELTAYNEKGRSHALSFETSRLLRDGAYLRLTVAPLRGVTAWEEVQPEELPRDARARFALSAE